jgi:hypothetical protein
MIIDGNYIEELIKSQSCNSVKWAQRNIKDVYKDRWEYIILANLKDQFTDATYAKLKSLITKEINLLRFVVDRISLVYKTASIREAVISDDGENKVIDEVYDKAIRDANINVTMKNVNTYTNMLNHVLVRPVIRDNKLYYDIHTFDNAEIITDPDDWRKIIGVVIYTGLVLPAYDEYYSYKTETGIYRVAEGEEFPPFEKYKYKYVFTIENDKSYIYQYEMYGKKINGEIQERLLSKEDGYYNSAGEPTLPFVLFSARAQIDEALDFSSRSDLLDATINTNINLVYLNQIIKFQSYKQVYIETDDPKTFSSQITTDPQSVWVLPRSINGGTTAAGTLDLQAAYDKLWQGIKDRILVVLSQYGIPPSAFEATGSPSSGFSKMVENITLLENRQDDIDRYRAYEKELYEKTVTVWNSDSSGEKMSTKAEFFIDFGDIDFPVQSSEKTQEWKEKIANNVATPVDWIMSENGDLDRDQALDEYKRNIVENRSTNQRDVTITPLQLPRGINADQQQDNDEIPE